MLKVVCASAALFAEIFAGIAAMLAVMVVPIFSQSTMAAPSSYEIQPLLTMIKVMAIVALDDCTIIVRMVPINKKISTEPKPEFVY